MNFLKDIESALIVALEKEVMITFLSKNYSAGNYAGVVAEFHPQDESGGIRRFRLASLVIREDGNKLFCHNPLNEKPKQISFFMEEDLKKDRYVRIKHTF